MLEGVTWFRQSALRIADGDRRVYIDPWGTDDEAPPADSSSSRTRTPITCSPRRSPGCPPRDPRSSRRTTWRPSSPAT